MKVAKGIHGPKSIGPGPEKNEKSRTSLDQDLSWIPGLHKSFGYIILLILLSENYK